MFSMNQTFDPATTLRKENVLFGAVGAFLFALVGGVIWYVLYQIGILAGISGIIAVVCAIRGYAVFSKGESPKGVFIATVMAALVIALSWYFCLSMDVYEAYLKWYAIGEVDFTLTRWEAIANAWWFLLDPDIAFAYLKDLILGLLLCVVGCVAPVRNAVARAKLQEESAATFSAPDFTVPNASAADGPSETSAASEDGGDSKDTDELPH